MTEKFTYSKCRSEIAINYQIEYLFLKLFANIKIREVRFANLF